MDVVIYTRDMEPITVIELPLWALELGAKHRFVNVAVPDDSLVEMFYEPETTARLHVVTLEFHPIMAVSGRKAWILTVNDEVLALRLRNSWLPGQRSKVNEYERVIRNLAHALLGELSRSRGEGL